MNSSRFSRRYYLNIGVSVSYYRRGSFSELTYRGIIYRRLDSFVTSHDTFVFNKYNLTSSLKSFDLKIFRSKLFFI